MKNDLLGYPFNTQWKHPLDSYHLAGTFDRYNAQIKRVMDLGFVENKICYLGVGGIIICNNNTSPATHKNSALRGVFSFWGKQNG